jgi:hypothetical protein
MNIDKKQVVELLRSRGQHDKATRAEAELPDQVDTDKHGGQLDELGVDAKELLGKLPGGFHL